MNLRKIRLSIVAGVLAVLIVALGLAQPAGKSAAVGAEVIAAAAAPQSNWVHWGCWSYFPSGGCRDIYRDPQGQYWRCSACGTTGTPGPTKCSKISTQTLATGYWCS